MDKKKIDIAENIVETQENAAAENQENKKTTYKKGMGFHKDKKEEISEEVVIKNKIEKKHKRRIVIGFIMVALMAVGVASIVNVIVGSVQTLFDNTAEKEKYNALLSTLVVADPLPFESPDQADQDVILASCVWAAVMNEDMSKFDKNDFGQTYLPAVEVDKYYAKVFGTQYKLEHRTFSDQGVDFEYVEDKKAYVIPETSFPTGFTPKVEKIKKVDGDKIVTVGYVSPSTSWTDPSDGSISKYVDYIFQKQGKEYYLVAIRESDMKIEVTPSASPSPSPAA